MAVLNQHASSLHELLSRYKENALSTLHLLDNVSTRLEHLAHATRPIYEGATAATRAQQNVSKAKVATEELLACLGIPSKLGPALKTGPSNGLQPWLAAVAELENAMDVLSSYAGLSAAEEGLKAALRLHERATSEADSALSAELVKIGSLPSSTPARDLADLCHADHDFVIPLLKALPAAPRENSRHLVDVLLRMVGPPATAASAARARVIHASLAAAGFSQPGLSGLQAMSTEALEKLTTGWQLHIRLVAVAVALEQQLVDELWPRPYNEQALPEAISSPLQSVLQAGRDLVDVRRPPERVFGLLDMHRSLMEALPLLDACISGRSGCVSLLNDVESLAGAIMRGARAACTEFEKSISGRQEVGGKSMPKVDVNDGTVSPRCATALTFLKRLFSYPNAGPVIFGAEEVRGTLPPNAAAAIRRITDSLMQWLQTTADGARSEALGSIFLLNNVHYMVLKVTQSLALSVLGDKWIEAHIDMLDEYREKYMEAAWRPIMRALTTADAAMLSDPGREKYRSAVKARLTSFNAALEAIATSQSSWVVPDVEERSKLRELILNEVMPVYEEFVETHGSTQFSRQPEKYLRFTPDDVADLISNNLFEGRPTTLRRVANMRDSGPQK